MKRIRNWKIRYILLSAALFFFLLGLLGASCWFLYRYAVYGEKSKTAVEIETGVVSGLETEYGAISENESDVLSETVSETVAEPLLKKEDTHREIRVQILGDDYQEEVHPSVTVSSAQGLVADCDGEEMQIPAGERWEITAEELEKDLEGCMTVKALEGGEVVLPKLSRSQPEPSYGGVLKLYSKENGICLVNEVDLEEYLYCVVSSEMPSDYPQEALRAQAVCARTYAFHCMEREENTDDYRDLDDSVSFQVYNNYQKTNASVTAVDETKGEILDCEEVLYYASSCLTEHRTDLDTEESFRQFLEEEPPTDAEYGSPWVRWSVTIFEEDILGRLEELYGCSWESLDRIRIEKRSGEGQVQKVVFSCQKEEIEAQGEYQIRKVLSPQKQSIHLRNGTEVQEMSLLPSAYFILEQTENRCWNISGGGYGHGKGMSQYGAAAMAEAGADYMEILEFYYGQ